MTGPTMSISSIGRADVAYKIQYNYTHETGWTYSTREEARDQAQESIKILFPNLELTGDGPWTYDGFTITIKEYDE